MKTRLYDALVILARFIRKKLGVTESIEIEIPNIVASMQVSLAGQIASAKREGYISEDNFLLLDKIEPVIRKQFDTFPTMKLPMGNVSFIVTVNDVEEILKELEAKAVVEEVICLPCQK